MKKITLLLTLALAATLHAAEVENLRCEYLQNPLGIDVAKPRLSWVLEDDKRGQKQTAYQILVASSPEILAKDQGDLWDSGKVVGDQSIQVEYAGKPLESQKACHWKVRVWDKDGEASVWSAPAQFVTGKMKPEDWQGQWIGASEDTKHAALYLQKKVTVEKPVVRASVFFCGLGFSELAIDGKKVGDYVIGPGFTTYNKRVQYLAFDVTDRFKKPGVHDLDVTLVDGWYGLSHDPWVHQFQRNAYVDKPKLLFNLHLQHGDAAFCGGGVQSSPRDWLSAQGTNAAGSPREPGEQGKNMALLCAFVGCAGEF